MKTTSYELPYSLDDRIAQAEACGFDGPSGYARFMQQLYLDPGKLVVRKPIRWPRKSDHIGEDRIVVSSFSKFEHELRKTKRPYVIRRMTKCDRCGQEASHDSIRYLYRNPDKRVDHILCGDCYNAITSEWLLDAENPLFTKGKYRYCMHCRQSFLYENMKPIYKRHPGSNKFSYPKAMGCLCKCCDQDLAAQMKFNSDGD